MTLPSLDFLAPIVADRAAHLGALDRLRVDAGGAGGCLSACFLADMLPERVNDVLPGAVFLPGNEVIPDGTLGSQIVGQIVPLTASTGLIHQRVDHLTQVHLARSAARLGRRKQILDQIPLLVRQVRSIRLAHGGRLPAWVPCSISLLFLGFTGTLASRIAFKFHRSASLPGGDLGLWLLPSYQNRAGKPTFFSCQTPLKSI